MLHEESYNCNFKFETIFKEYFPKLFVEAGVSQKLKQCIINILCKYPATLLNKNYLLSLEF